MKLIKKIIVSLFIMILAVSCGDAYRNDQGTSITFLGWFDEADRSSGITGSYYNPVIGSFGTGDLLFFAGIQNNLESQFVRINRIHHNYFIPNSDIQPPSTSAGLSVFLDPERSNIDETFGEDSTLPSNFGEGDAVATVFGEVEVVPSSIADFLTLNKSNLPEMPYVMIVDSYASGVSSAGRVIETNSVQFEIKVTNASTQGIGADTNEETSSEATTPTTASSNTAASTGITTSEATATELETDSEQDLATTEETTTN